MANSCKIISLRRNKGIRRQPRQEQKSCYPLHGWYLVSSVSGALNLYFLAPLHQWADQAEPTLQGSLPHARRSLPDSVPNACNRQRRAETDCRAGDRQAASRTLTENKGKSVALLAWLLANEEKIVLRLHVFLWVDAVQSLEEFRASRRELAISMYRL